MTVLWITIALVFALQLWILRRLHDVGLKVNEVADRLYSLDKDLRG